mmetsp:Transcript_17489/g.43603  ORF Transcript_17489/g.43603 Transcript_17489/m.43603 type:complete len:296 (+) Transcript_17489:98-985(+)
MNRSALEVVIDMSEEISASAGEDKPICRRGRDLKPRKRRNYAQLEQEGVEFHFCPFTNCSRKYVGSYGSFNLYVHIKKKHTEASHLFDPAILRKRRPDIEAAVLARSGKPRSQHSNFMLSGLEAVVPMKEEQEAYAGSLSKLSASEFSTAKREVKPAAPTSQRYQPYQKKLPSRHADSERETKKKEDEKLRAEPFQECNISPSEWLQGQFGDDEIGDLKREFFSFRPSGSSQADVSAGEDSNDYGGESVSSEGDSLPFESQQAYVPLYQSFRCEGVRLSDIRRLSDEGLTDFSFD